MKRTVIFWFNHLNKFPILLIATIFYGFYTIKKRVKETIHWHEFFYQICRKFHFPTVIVSKVEVLFFQDPYRHEADVSKFLFTKAFGKLFIDVGANLGRYTILLGRNFDKVIAVEPDPNNVFFLMQNVKQANLSNVKILQCAVSDKDGTAFLYFSSHIAGHTLCKNLGKGEILVRTRTLASIIQSNTADLVKVDVEGAEWLVLKGAEPILDRIKAWVVELHNPKRKRELEQWFVFHGYSFKWLDFRGKTANHIYAWRKQN